MTRLDLTSIGGCLLLALLVAALFLAGHVINRRRQAAQWRADHAPVWWGRPIDGPGLRLAFPCSFCSGTSTYHQRWCETVGGAGRPDPVVRDVRRVGRRKVEGGAR